MIDTASTIRTIAPTTTAAIIMVMSNKTHHLVLIIIYNKTQIEISMISECNELVLK